MSIDLPGFADPVTDAQSAFRAVLDAMARPGSRHAAGTGLTPPAPLDPATAAVLLTLADADTKLWLAPNFQSAQDWIAFHCGAACIDDIAVADFVVTDTLPDLATLNAGTDDGPEESTTVILQIAGFTAPTGDSLAGPGLRVPVPLVADGLPTDFAARWAANHALYPRGIDIVLCNATTLAALPRSVSIRKG